MDIKASVDEKTVGITASGEEKYVWFAESESVWEELQIKLYSCKNLTHTFENGSVLEVNGETCLFTGINDGQEVFKIQCDKTTMFGKMGHAKMYVRQ